MATRSRIKKDVKKPEEVKEAFENRPDLKKLSFYVVIVNLGTDEMLIALSSSASSNPLAKSALDQLSGLRGAEAHSSVILSRVDENVYRKLGLRLTCTPEYETGKDFV